MLADTIVADAAVSGRRRAGVFTGVWTAAETVVFGHAALACAKATYSGRAGGSSDVELTVAAPGDRDGLQAGGRGAYFDRTGGGVEL